MKKINRSKFINDLINKFDYIKIKEYEYIKNCYYIKQLENDNQIGLIQFNPQTKRYFQTIYISIFEDDNINNYIVNYFKNIKLENKNFQISDIKNNYHIIN